MSDEKRIEISLNIIVLLITILINLVIVVWFAAELKTEVIHVKAQVEKNSGTISKLSEILIKEK